MLVQLPVDVWHHHSYKSLLSYLFVLSLPILNSFYLFIFESWKHFTSLFVFSNFYSHPHYSHWHLTQSWWFLHNIYSHIPSLYHVHYKVNFVLSGGEVPLCFIMPESTEDCVKGYFPRLWYSSLGNIWWNMLHESVTPLVNFCTINHVVFHWTRLIRKYLASFLIGILVKHSTLTT